MTPERKKEILEYVAQAERLFIVAGELECDPGAWMHSASDVPELIRIVRLLLEEMSP
jgi:hypothetical protein